MAEVDPGGGLVKVHLVKDEKRPPVVDPPGKGVGFDPLGVAEVAVEELVQGGEDDIGVVEVPLLGGLLLAIWAKAKARLAVAGVHHQGLRPPFLLGQDFEIAAKAPLQVVHEAPCGQDEDEPLPPGQGGEGCGLGLPRPRGGEEEVGGVPLRYLEDLPLEGGGLQAKPVVEGLGVVRFPRPGRPGPEAHPAFFLSEGLGHLPLLQSAHQGPPPPLHDLGLLAPVGVEVDQEVQGDFVHPEGPGVQEESAFAVG